MDDEPEKCLADQLNEIESGFYDVQEFSRASTIRAAAIQLERYRNALEAVWEMTEGYADGAPDATPHDLLALKVSSVAGTVLGKYR